MSARLAVLLLLVAALALGLGPLVTGGAFAGQWLLGVLCAVAALVLAVRICAEEEGR